MSRIFYSVGAEGRGHATRVRTVIESIRYQHKITLFAPGHAYELLEPIYRHSPVKVKPIPGISQYNIGSRLSYIKTGWYGMQYLVQLPGLLKELRKEIDSGQPDLVITDFEPSLPRAACDCGVPFISLNHQHFLLTYDLSSLPDYLQKQSALMARVVQSFYKGQKETIVSSFYFPPLKPEYKNTTQIGILLRPEILQAKTSTHSYLVAYLRRNPPLQVLKALELCGIEVRVYGLGARPCSGLMRFYEVNACRFVEDLAGCRGLISTAGNQLIGEALFLNKPVLCMPELNNYEQEINAHFLNESGGGRAVPMEQFSLKHIQTFLDNLDQYKLRFDHGRLNGNPGAIKAIKRHLSDKSDFDKSYDSIFSQTEAAL
jgi:uncharacterized protein (TIGR00661 family)